ncbi:MAG: hypothetical protein IPJ41_01705 [Phycisphaerales bacterium]|nr:hypothetical protein [Phycisphaerales bacterium]
MRAAVCQAPCIDSDIEGNLRRMEHAVEQAAAEDIQTVETPIGRVSMLICADSFIDDNVAAVRACEPDLVVVPSGWAAEPGDRPAHGESLHAWVTSVARRTHCPVVGTHLVGAVSAEPWNGKTYGGQSVGADGEGSVLGVLRDRDPEVRVFELTIGGRADAPGS